MTDTQLTLIIGFGTQVLTALGIFANQQLQGQKADRLLRERALELQEAAARTHAKLDTLTDLQVENTRVTERVGERADAAYKEANDVNMKMLDLRRGNKETLNRIEATTVDTNVAVHGLKENGTT